MRAAALIRPLCLLSLLVPVACARFPEVEQATSPQAVAADFPELVPLEPLLAAAASTRPAPEAQRADIAARTAALKARADALRNRRIADDSRLRDAVDRG